MREESPSALAPRRAWGRSKLVAATLALTMGALGAGLAATALPAYADVVSSTYTIGSPSPGVGGVTATPASVTAGGSTNFQVMFTAASAISGSSSSWINLTTSVPSGPPRRTWPWWPMAVSRGPRQALAARARCPPAAC